MTAPRASARAGLWDASGARAPAHTDAVEAAVFVLHGRCGAAPEAYGNQVAALLEAFRRAPAALRRVAPVALALMHPAKLAARLAGRPGPAEAGGAGAGAGGAEAVPEFFRLIRELEAASLAASAGGEAHLRCPHCGGREVLPQVKQTRSADEGGTYYGLCLSPACGKQYRLRFGQIRL